MPPALSHVPRTIVIQRACTLDALFVLVVQGSMGDHMLLVNHSRCPEHRELVHNRHAHPRTAQELPSPTSTEMRGCPNGDTAGAHDHCSVSARVNLLELNAGLSWWFLDLGLQIFNLLDAQYAAQEYVFESNWNPSAPPSGQPARHIAAGAPRTLLFLIGFRL